MPARGFRGKRGRSSDLGTDRAVITGVVLAVTTVLLIIGFAGSSDYFTLPGPTGWLYIAVVIIVAAVAIVMLFSSYEKQNRGNPAGSRAVNRKSKRIRLQLRCQLAGLDSALLLPFLPLYWIHAPRMAPPIPAWDAAYRP